MVESVTVNDEVAGSSPASPAKFPKGYGKLRIALERRQRYERAIMWLAFRFDLAAMDRESREHSIREQMASTGGIDPAALPKPNEIAYLKFSEL